MRVVVDQLTGEILETLPEPRPHGEQSGPKAASAARADQPGEPALQSAVFIQSVQQRWPGAKCVVRYKRSISCGKCREPSNWRLFHTCNRA